MSGEAMTFSGGCRCGAVRYQAAAEALCPLCATPLLSEAETRPHLIIVRAGSLDDPNSVTPTMTIWTASAPAWACFDGSLAQHAGQPPPTP